MALAHCAAAQLSVSDLTILIQSIEAWISLRMKWDGRLCNGHMAEQGKSEGTRFSYGMELKLAQAELGSDALVTYLTPESIALFNEAPRVCRVTK